jgi:hypothetical protein
MRRAVRYNPSVGDAYRDENQAALAAVSQLREENALLRSQIDDVRRRLGAAEYRAGLGRARSGGALWLVGFAVATGAGLFAVAVVRPGGAAQTHAPSTAPTSNRDFDHHLAEETLASIDLSVCARPGGPSGSGHVLVTFDPNGNARTALVEPPIGGTPVGSCLATRFTQARIPPFFGGPAQVGHSFVLAP